MKRPILFFFLLFYLNSNYLIAQLSHGGEPLSFKQPLLKNLAVYSTPGYDYLKLIEEDKEPVSAKPYRYGKTHDVNISPNNSGTWNIAENGYRIWQIKINSAKAYAIGLIFNEFNLNEGVMMFVYSADRKKVIGSFTSENNKKTGWFTTIPLSGEEIIVELDVPVKQEFGILNISGIVHDYRNAFGLKTGYGASESCNVNINCTEGTDWQDEKRAVARYTYGSGGFEYFCSGVLLNNTSFNSKPYFLTAEHCIGSQATANTALFMFNYESEKCISTFEPAYQSISSATLIATGDDLDFTLLELSENPPASFNVYFAGWNRGTNPAKKTVTIHHPQGDIKKISVDNNPPIIGDYGSGYYFNSHWKILEWDMGTTEGGSSGAPLFDENHYVVGGLTGGDAYCSYNLNDYFARFDLSWDHYSLQNKQLKAWLDPLNTGTFVLDGFDPEQIANGTDIGIIQIKSPVGEYCAETEIVPEVTIQNKGTVDLTSARINYKLNNTVVSKIWTGNLKSLQKVNFKFDPISAPSGNNKFISFTSLPNDSVDLFNYNDTIKSDFFGQDPIINPQIDGPSEICRQKLNGIYSSKSQGNYIWQLIGGSFENDNTTQSVSINWNDWGERLISLNVTNLCNSADAEPIAVNVVEQSLQLEISTGYNGESVCWSVQDCDGNVIYNECNLSSDENNISNICLKKGCYHLLISSQINGVSSYKLSNLVNSQVILEGNSINGSTSKEFELSLSSSDAGFNVYPNPAQNELIIEATFQELYSDSQFAIYRMNGSMLIPFNKLDDRKIIDISNLNKGIYIIEINSSHGKFSKKFVKP